MANYCKVYRSHYTIIKNLAKQHYQTDEPNSKKFAHGFNSMWSVYTVLCIHRTYGSKNAYHNQCSFSLSGLATACGLGKATVKKAVSLLESKNIIKAEIGMGYNSVTLYSFPMHDVEEPKPLPKQAETLAELMKDEGIPSFEHGGDISQRPSNSHDWHPRLKKWVTVEEMKARLRDV